MLFWIFFGLIAGAIAKYLMPGPDPGGIIVTMLIGIVGSMIGGFIGTFLGYGGMNTFEFDLGSFALAILGSVILLYGYRKMR